MGGDARSKRDGGQLGHVSPRAFQANSRREYGFPRDTWYAMT